MLSAVIPVYNEVESLAELVSEIDEVARENSYDIEIVFVDDGSTDGSWAEIERLSVADPRIRGIRFRRNFGKAAALDAGFQEARGELVFTLDADLQDDPHEIPNFLEAMENNLDVVSGWKKVRHDPWHKVGPSRVFNWLVGFLTGVRLHDHNCGFKCYRREIFDEVNIYGELHRFVPVLAVAKGWQVGEIVVNHRARQYGHSKYGVRRIVKGFLDLLTVYFLTGFGRRPQHLLGTLGLLGFAVGAVGVALLSMMWIVSRLDGISENDLHLHERAMFYYSMGALLLGSQFLSVGLLAEMITAFYGRESEQYSIRERTTDSPIDGTTTESDANEGSADS
ncbi:MAG: glycosyltransferase [Planctomycetaceae bacterium]|nr:glycosyltransferase [Planctomycetaceae bacterium]